MDIKVYLRLLGANIVFVIVVIVVNVIVVVILVTAYHIICTCVHLRILKANVEFAWGGWGGGVGWDVGQYNMICQLDLLYELFD